MLDTQKYQAYSLGKCMSHLFEQGICLRYQDYLDALLNVEDWDEIINNILKRFNISVCEENEEQIETITLLYALLEKLAAELPICAKDHAFIQQEIQCFMQPCEAENQEEQYALFFRRYELLKRLIDYAQYKKITSIQAIDTYFGCEIETIFKYYQKEAYEILPKWQHHDIVHHQNFSFHFIAYFEELYVKYQESIQCDVADLYMLHGDESKAHRAYLQLLKQSKEYGKVAHRYAKIVKQCEEQKVKNLVEKLMESNQLDKKWEKELLEMIS